jgi:isoleucyl-tRNA synthetase
MPRRDYNVFLKFPTYYTSEVWSFDSWDDRSDQATRNCISTYEQYDPECLPQVLGVELLPDPVRKIDYQTLKNMKLIRSICDLGKRLRATNNINLRQPLQSVYIYVSDYVTRFYVNRDLEDWSSILEEELNVHEIIFINDVSDNTLFDISMKPNFRTLGPKGHGKAAQALKKTMEQLSIDQSNAIYCRLLNGAINDFGFPLSLEDIEVVLKPKDGFCSLSNDAGAVILDTKITPFLKKKGLVYELKSCIQKLRKDNNLSLQDRVIVTVYTSSEEISEGVSLFSHFLKHECAINELTIKHINEIAPENSGFDNEQFSIDLKRV